MKTNWMTEFKKFYHNQLSSVALTASAVNKICFFFLFFFKFYWLCGKTESSSACNFVFYETKS